MNLIMTYLMAEILAELFFGIIFPVLTHTMRHELGHATEYLKQLEPDDEKMHPIIHIGKHVIVTPLMKLQAKVSGIEIKRDVREYMEVKENESCCSGITEMPADMDDTSIKKVACAGVKNNYFSILLYEVVVYYVMFQIRLIWVKGFGMSPDIIDFRILFMFFTATVWFLTDTIAFLLSGKNEGDFYFFRHPEKWREE